MRGLRYGLAIGALLALTVLGAPRLRAADKKPLSRFAGNPRRTPIVHLVQRVRGAVVNVHSERLVREDATRDLLAFTPSKNRINGMGTAIVIDPRGYLVTNHHVIEDVSLIRVRLADGTSTHARVIASDPQNDLALLKIDVDKPLPTMTFGTAKDLMVGETVVAIGNAYGYDHTVTVGVVSAYKRDVNLNKKISYKDLIQTDASINPGNSGGPLMNVRGELIGVNVAIRAGAQGIGFAIPVDTMLKVAADMLASKRRLRLNLGMVVRDVAIASEESPLERHLVVDRVHEKSAAMKAGLKRGDVIASVGNEMVKCRLDLERALLDRAAGDVLTLRARRDQKLQVAQLKLGAAELEFASPATMIWEQLGLKLEPVSNDVGGLADHELRGGLFVVSVQRNGAASRAGIQEGDVLVGLHKWEMTKTANVLYVLQRPDLESLAPLQFCVIRDGRVQWGWLRPGN